MAFAQLQDPEEDEDDLLDGQRHCLRHLCLMMLPCCVEAMFSEAASGLSWARCLHAHVVGSPHAVQRMRGYAAQQRKCRRRTSLGASATFRNARSWASALSRRWVPEGGGWSTLRACTSASTTSFLSRPRRVLSLHSIKEEYILLVTP